MGTSNQWKDLPVYGPHSKKTKFWMYAIPSIYGIIWWYTRYDRRKWNREVPHDLEHKPWLHYSGRGITSFQEKSGQSAHH